MPHNMHVYVYFSSCISCMSPDHINLILFRWSLCVHAGPFCPTNSSALWILCGVFPPGLSVFNATVSLQALKVLGFNASVTVFFHRADCRLPGKLRVVCMCVRALVPFLEASLCSLCPSARATEASWVRFSCGWTTYPRILLGLEECPPFSRRQTPLLSPHPVLTGCVWPWTHHNRSALGCRWLQ